MINSDEYPQTAEIENRCFNLISRLLHAPDAGAADTVARRWFRLAQQHMRIAQEFAEL